MQRFKSKFEELVSANLYQEDENIQTLNKLLSLGRFISIYSFYLFDLCTWSIKSPFHNYTW